MQYIKRVVDLEIERKLEASGAVLIKGPKACGKTATAKQLAKSVLQLDQDPQVPLLMDLDPQKLLEGETPRLVDEWQEHPKIWDYIRHQVDDRQKSGQFILTGSAQPNENAKTHSGAGRFTFVEMRTLSWAELGYSDGTIRLSQLLEGKPVPTITNQKNLAFITEKMAVGGFPNIINRTVEQALDINRAYVELLTEVDMSRVSNIKRDPKKIRALLKSLARNTATLVDLTTLEKDIRYHENTSISRPTVYDYLDALERQMIIENQPAWNTHLRSSHVLRKAPKRHFTDVSLAIAALGIDQNQLSQDLLFTGFLFESLVIHDLRVYAQANDARVYHYLDSSSLEVDAIVQKHNGQWCAFEIKLGTAEIDQAAENLQLMAQKIDTTRCTSPMSLNIITGTGFSYTRKDGVNVISLANLGV
jgi:hypothetical protein